MLGLARPGYEMPKVLAHVPEGYPLIDGDDSMVWLLGLGCAL